MLSNYQNQIILHKIQTIINLKKFKISLYQINLFTTLKTTLFYFKNYKKNYLINKQYTNYLNKLFILKILNFSFSYFYLILQISLKI